MTIDLVPVLGSLAALTVVVGGITAALVAIRRWIRNVARPAQQAADQLATSNGQTIGQYVEQVASDVTAVKAELGTLSTTAAENRELATAALALARHTGERLDAHLSGHGKDEQ